jgi:hypothetical protein
MTSTATIIVPKNMDLYKLGCKDHMLNKLFIFVLTLFVFHLVPLSQTLVTQLFRRRGLGLN